MNLADRKKLAKAARALAMECVVGTAPEFNRVATFHANGSPGCVLGHLYARVGVDREQWLHQGGSGGMIDFDMEAPVWEANDRSAPEDRHGAVVFPLLWLATELDGKIE